MAQALPKHPNLAGGFAPLQMECDAFDLVIEGEVPKDLFGSFYRNGPNPQYAPRGHYHWFGGDGMIHAFQIENGKVSYKNRWSRTQKWQLDRDAGRCLFGSLNPMDSDESVMGMQTDGSANTNIIWHGGKLLALEEGHAPFELDPLTLESKGAWKFKEQLTGPMTAHPKIDPKTGEMLFFGYSVDGALSEKMSFHVVDRDGVLTRSQFFDAPYAAMVHDFMVTEDYVLFPIQPLTASLERAMSGGPAFAWEPEKGNQIGIMPRRGSVDEIRWFTNQASYVFHPMNSYNDGQRIICDVSEYGQAPLFPNVDGSKGDPEKMKAKLKRWTFDLDGNTDSYTIDDLSDVECEFGRLDERFSCHDYRYGYMLCNGDQEPEAGAFNGITMVDHQTGRLNKYSMAKTLGTSEAIFVPKSDAAAEGEGYLLSNVYDAETDKSHLLILDAQNPSAGPLAKAVLDHRMPFGFHGNWRDGRV